MKRFKLGDKYSTVKQQIAEIYHKHKGRYGYRRITCVLKNQGVLINHKCVYRLMQEIGLKSVVRPVKYKSYKGTVGRIADNVLNREFEARACPQFKKGVMMFYNKTLVYNIIINYA